MKAKTEPKYRKPVGTWVGKNEETERLYELEEERDKAFKAAAKELQKIMKFKHFWQVAVPEALLSMLEGWDHNAAALGAQAYLEKLEHRAYYEHGAVVVQHVDLDLLEKQRQALIVLRERLKLSFEEHEEQALDGIIGMLDAWSDERLGRRP